MNLPSIEFRFGDCRSVEEFLAERIYGFNAKATGAVDGEAFAATQPDEAGAIVGGVCGYTWAGCCFVCHRSPSRIEATALVARSWRMSKGARFATLPGDHRVVHDNVFFAEDLEPGGTVTPGSPRAANGPLSMPVVRPFSADDYGAARALWEATPGVGLSGADEREAIGLFLRRNPGLSFVAEHEGRIVGTILCGHDGRRGWIHHLVTAPACRRRGVGRALLRRGLGALRDQGIQKCHLMVYRDNSDGRAFWRAVQARERHELSLFSISTEGAI